jgi:hypothetical protein
MSYNKSVRYHKGLKRLGANLKNILNWYAHYLYGTSVEKLTELSNEGVVYNPPGH